MSCFLKFSTTTLLLLFTNSIYAADGLVGEYSLSPNGKSAIKVGKTNKGYLVKIDIKLKELRRPLKGDCNAVIEPNKAFKAWFSSSWVSKVDSMLYLNECSSRFVKFNNSYKLDSNLYDNKNIVYANENGNKEYNGMYVFGFYNFYFGVYKIK